MLEFEPANPVKETLEQKMAIPPISFHETTLRVRSYDENRLVFDPISGNERGELRRIDPNEDDPLFSGIKIPKEDNVLRKLLLHGPALGLVRTSDTEVGRIADKVAAISEEVDAVAELHDEAVALTAIARRIAAHKNDAQRVITDEVNAHLEIVETSDRPYWVLVEDFSPVEEGFILSGSAHTYSLAKLAAIQITDEGTVRSILRQSNGFLGYKEGRVQLYR